MAAPWQLSSPESEQGAGEVSQDAVNFGRRQRPRRSNQNKSTGTPGCLDRGQTLRRVSGKVLPSEKAPPLSARRRTQP